MNDTDHDRVLALDGDLRVLAANVVALQDSIAERFTARDQALALQATEYERRLEDLNHEAARIAADKAEYATNERVNGALREVTARFEGPITANAEHIANLEIGVLKTATYEAAHQALVGRVDTIEREIARGAGVDRAQQRFVAFGFSLLGLLIAMASVVIIATR